VVYSHESVPFEVVLCRISSAKHSDALWHANSKVLGSRVTRLRLRGGTFSSLNRGT
jgi:hypothetical protein